MKKDTHHHFIPNILRKYIDSLPEWSPEKSINFEPYFLKLRKRYLEVSKNHEIKWNYALNVNLKFRTNFTLNRFELM